MKSIRVEVFRDPPRERILVDGKELSGATFEVAFLDAPATSMTLAEFVGTTKVSAVGGKPEEKATITKERENATVVEDKGTADGLAAKPAAETKEGTQ